jgi:hypothetical protein
MGTAPLGTVPITRNPLQRRSRYLDLHKHAQRSFYVGSMENLAVIDPAPAVPTLAGDFQAWIVEETEEFSGVATLAPVRCKDEIVGSTALNSPDLRD